MDSYGMGYVRPNGEILVRVLTGDDFVLQQDNYSVPVSLKTLEFLEGAGIEVLPWPSRSPDLNLIQRVGNDQLSLKTQIICVRKLTGL